MHVPLDDFARAVVQVRREMEPHAGDADSVLVKCRTCPTMFRRRRRGKVRYCEVCAASRALDATERMAAREGPFYEATVRKSLAHWLSEAERLGIDPANL